jgi:hypothetical protein
MIGTREYKNIKEKIMQKMDILPSSRMVKAQPIIQYDHINDDAFKTIEHTSLEEIISARELLPEYHYLENNLLNQTFSLCSSEADNYTIYFCIYSIKQNMENIPYLTFLLENQDEICGFPKIDFACSHQEDMDTYFTNECFKHFFDMVKTENIDPDVIDDIYKGFIDNGKDIYVVFDASKLNYTVGESNIVAIMDEILNVKMIGDVPIDENVTKFFLDNRYMIHIVKQIGDMYNKIEYPFVIYNIKDDMYQNKFSDEINTTRYGLFTSDAEYLVSDLNVITDEQKQIVMAMEKNIYFHENGQQFWKIADKNKLVELSNVD